MTFSSIYSDYTPEMFEKWVMRHLQSLGHQVKLPPKNQIGYDLEIVRRGQKSIAVQCKYYKATRANKTQVAKFKDWMGMFSTKQQFSEGWIISANGYSISAMNLLNRNINNDNSVSLGTIYNDDIRWDYKTENNVENVAPVVTMEVSETVDKHYIGVFTNKGGTGKTTVAAHLAGAFAMIGHDVVLIDGDPQGNLKKLLRNTDDLDDASLYVESPAKGKIGGAITVLSQDEWKVDKDSYDDTSIIICDCSPTLDENPDYLMKQFDYCIIPTTLNPLGIAKNSEVIQRTLDKIADRNLYTEKFVLCNQYVDRESDKVSNRRNKLLINMLKQNVNFNDAKTHMIDPDDIAIHRSNALYYWGMHTLEQKDPELAFTAYGGKSIPRQDFLKLAEYFLKRLFIK